MALFVMADTHLSFSTDKPMDIFGQRWIGHAQKIRDHWMDTVSAEDTVVIPGDISWGMNLEESLPDFLFLQSLPGKKILLKGNHDYWWDTMTKMTAFNQENGLDSISYLHNNAYRCEDFILCGSRGWYTEGKRVVTANEIDTEKIVAREVGRLRASLQAGHALREQVLSEEGFAPEILVFLHFPPYFTGYICDELVLELYRFDIKRCYFGHIHGNYQEAMVRHYLDIEFTMISADHLQFVPYRIEKRM